MDVAHKVRANLARSLTHELGNGLRWSLLGLQGRAPSHLWLRGLRPVSATARATKPNLDNLLLTTAGLQLPLGASARVDATGVVRCHVSDASCSNERPLGRCGRRGSAIQHYHDTGRLCRRRFAPESKKGETPSETLAISFTRRGFRASGLHSHCVFAHRDFIH